MHFANNDLANNGLANNGLANNGLANNNLADNNLADTFMPNDSKALERPPGATSEDDYRSLLAAIEASARGRDFLAEYARRNRHADTETLLAAFDRLESLMRAEGTALERLRDELRLLLIAIRLARPDIDAASPPTKAARLASLLDLLERRIDAMAENKPVDIALPAEAPKLTPAALAIVPRPDEPELPIPSPAAAQPPAIALVQELKIQELKIQELENKESEIREPVIQEPKIQESEAAELAPPWEPVFERDVALSDNAPEKWLPDFGDDPAQIVPTHPPHSTAFMPEVSFFGGAHPEQAVVEVPAPAPPEPAAVAVQATVEIATPAIVTVEVAAPAIVIEPAPKPAAALPASDPLAAIMALSEDERIALFT